MECVCLEFFSVAHPGPWCFQGPKQWPEDFFLHWPFYIGTFPRNEPEVPGRSLHKSRSPCSQANTHASRSNAREFWHSEHLEATTPRGRLFLTSVFRAPMAVGFYRDSLRQRLQHPAQRHSRWVSQKLLQLPETQLTLDATIQTETHETVGLCTFKS